MSKKNVHDCVHSGDLNGVKKVIGKGSPNVTNSKGQTPLHIACSDGHLPIVLWLLDKKKADVNAKDQENWTPIHSACNGGHLEVVDQLLSHGADVGVITANGTTVLDYYVRITEQNKRPALFDRLFKVLIKKGIDVNSKNSNGETAIHSAAFRGKSIAVKHLLHSKADPNIPNKYGETALHLAVRSGNIQSVKYLLDANANVSVRGQNGTPIELAASKPDILRLFEQSTGQPAQGNSSVPDPRSFANAGIPQMDPQYYSYNRAQAPPPAAAPVAAPVPTYRSGGLPPAQAYNSGGLPPASFPGGPPAIAPNSPIPRNYGSIRNFPQARPANPTNAYASGGLYVSTTQYSQPPAGGFQNSGYSTLYGTQPNYNQNRNYPR